MSLSGAEILSKQWGPPHFADAAGLKKYLGRGLGSIDPAAPDQIQNPKLQLKHLLGDGQQLYTSILSEEIARVLEPGVIARRSPSFSRFLNAVRNGGA